jgi:hypothetical protein
MSTLLHDTAEPARPVPFTLTPKAHAALAPAGAINRDQPIPFTLTPKALAALTPDSHGPVSPGQVMCCGCGYDDCSACAVDGWACPRCGAAYFGTPPGDGLCPDCHGRTAAP